MTLQIQNAKNMTVQNCHYMLVGQAGSGKTTQASSFPDPFFVISSAEPGLVNLRGKNIKYVMVENADEMFEGCELAINSKAGTIVIDSLSVHLEHLVRQIEGKKGSMSGADWGEVIRHATILSDYLRQHPVNVVYTVFANPPEVDKVTGRTCSTPMLYGKLARRFAGKCEFVIYLENRVTANGAQAPMIERRAWFQADGMFEAKCNLDLDPPFPPFVQLQKGRLWPDVLEPKLRGVGVGMVPAPAPRRTAAAR
jgi:hypothetical protein